VIQTDIIQEYGDNRRENIQKKTYRVCLRHYAAQACDVSRCAAVQGAQPVHAATQPRCVIIRAHVYGSASASTTASGHQPSINRYEDGRNGDKNSRQEEGRREAEKHTGCPDLSAARQTPGAGRAGASAQHYARCARSACQRQRAEAQRRWRGDLFRHSNAYAAATPRRP